MAELSMTTTPNIVSKFDAAAVIAQGALELMVGKCVEGESVFDICAAGEAYITEELKKVYSKREKDVVTGEFGRVPKGIAFPICLSIDNCICHWSPIALDPKLILKKGNLCKIDLGMHMGGYAVVVAHSIVIGASKDEPITGKMADVMMATHNCIEAAHRMLRPGTKSEDITKMVSTVAESFKCKPVEGMLSHNLIRWKVDGDKGIIQNPNQQQNEGHKECVIAEGDVFAMDVVLSTGSGVAKLASQPPANRPTIFKRTAIQQVAPFKDPSSEWLLNKIDELYPLMAFTVRTICEFGEEQKVYNGIQELFQQKLIEPFYVLFDDAGEYICQLKFTAMVNKTSTRRLTRSLVEPDCFKSEHEIVDEEIKKILAEPAPMSKKAKKSLGKKLASV